MSKIPAKDLYEVIYDVVRAIPPGRVSTYGHVAACIGLRSGARMVGYALNQCHGTQPAVPAHRVVNRVGLLTGRHHFPGPETMEQLLIREGIEVADHQVVDFHNLLWNPATEIGI